MLKQAMTDRKTTTRLSTDDLEQLIEYLAPGLVTTILLLVLFATLFPFDFSLKDGFSIKGIFNNFYKSDSLIDFLVNILLFLPLGFSLASLRQKKLRGIAAILDVLVACAGLSFLVEVLQVFLPSRSSSYGDILANTIGGFLGSLAFHQCRFKILGWLSALLQNIRKRLSIKTLTVCFIGYASLVCLVPFVLQSTTTLNNWDPAFPLLLGNERTGDRPWRGTVSEVYIADRAISEEEVARTFTQEGLLTAMADSLVASYQLTGRGNYPDRTGHIPALSWQRQSPDAQTGTGAFLTSSHWLETTTPAVFLTQKIRQTSQFTLSAIVATADTAQKGPARIVSLSGSPYERNFTLGQQKADLVFRLRTPLTGEGGAKPDLLVPKVFTDTKPHHLVITYGGSVLRIYMDRLQNSYSFALNPGVTFFSYLFPFLGCHLKTENLRYINAIYYGIAFIPLGFILSLITTIGKKQSIFQLLWISSGLFLPACILEGILSRETGDSMRLGNILLSIAIEGGTLLIVKQKFASRLKNARTS